MVFENFYAFNFSNIFLFIFALSEK